MIRDLVRTVGPTVAPACISITNQRETFVVFDRHNGRPLHNAIVWQCRRGTELCRKLVDSGEEDRVQAKTGLKIDTYFTASKLCWLIQNHPELASRLAQGDALVGTIDCYLIYRLTHGSVFATDHTNASRTLLYDIHQLDWDDELCRLFETPRRALPEVRESAAEFGHTEVEGILPDRIPIRGVMGDSQASLFAQRCYEPGTAKATLGSGTSVLLNIGERATTARGGAVLALAWVLNGRPTYALEGLINYTGATIEWLKNQLCLIASAEETETLSTLVSDNGGTYVVPAFAGMGAPYWNSDARAAIIGMTSHTMRAHVVRAAVESIAYQLRDVLDMMGSEAGVRPQTVQADGGATSNRFLMQFIADICDVELSVSTVPELSALGAAWSGLIGLGVIPSLQIIKQLPRESHIYRPRMDAFEANQLYSGWQSAVQRVL